MLELFPERMMDSSIHTAILLGILVLWGLTETLGFVFAGFVVAGYLAAMGVVAPVSLAATVLEAVLTYGVVHLVGRVAADRGLWSHVFGRERFLLFILVSIPVRLLVEGVAADGFETLLAPLSDAPAWRGARFFGIGVVLVPLLANAFWKLGLARGLLQVGVSAAIVWALLVGVLGRWTNFHLGGFELIFEDLALHFLAVPRVYVVLVTTAFVAARNNLRYGWDFGGILVPSLLAIVAFNPMKLVSTVVEVAVLVVLYKGLIRLPVVRELDLGGPRRIVSMYGLSWGLKWLIATAALRLAPTLYVSDLFGFGYLLTSLVAVRAVVKGHTARTVTALLVTTGQGLGLGLLVSLGLGVILPDRRGEEGIAAPPRPEESLERSVLLVRGSLRAAQPDPTAYRSTLPLARRLAALSRGALSSGGEQEGWRERWTVRADGRRCLLLEPSDASAVVPAGAPFAWWCGGDGPALFINRPLGDPDSLWTGAWLAHRGDFSAVLVDGTDTLEDATGALSRWRRLRELLDTPTVLTLETHPTGASWLDPFSAGTAAQIEGHLGPAEGAEIRFSPTERGLRRLLRPRDGRLSLSVAEVGRALPELPEEREGWLLEGPELRGPQSPLRERRAAAELLLDTALRWSAWGQSPRPLRWMGTLLGVEVSLVPSGEWSLRETRASPRGFGRWLIAPGARSPWVVAAPRSAAEEGTGEIAHRLFRRLEARALWVSGHSERYQGGQSLAAEPERMTLEALALRQALRPRASDPGSTKLLLVRAQPSLHLNVFDERPRGLVLSTGHELFSEDQQRALMQPLQRALWDWPGVDYQAGQAWTASMSAFGVGPVKYLNALRPGSAAIAWFSPALLAEGTQREERLRWYREQGVHTGPIDELAGLLAQVDPARPVTGPEALTQPLRRQVEQLDEASLAALRAAAGEDLQVLDQAPRVPIVAWTSRVLCAASAGARDEDVRFPLNGCWEITQGRRR